MIEHDVRLDILCYLDPEQPMRIEQLSAGAEVNELLATYHLRVLEAFGLVGVKRGGGGPPRYIVRLTDQPGWVKEAIEAHRRA